MTAVQPTALALAMSKAYGYCRPAAEIPVRWAPCPACWNKPLRMTVCRECHNTGKIAVMQA